jgi:hypothetical protein
VSEEQVHLYADQLRMLATHFVERDWDYTRDKGGLTAIRYDYPEDTLRGRIKASLKWLFRRQREWEKVLKVGRFRMAWYALQRDTHLPDGVLDGGNVIVHWEETGEYLQYVQPTVGALLADLMDQHADLPAVKTLAAEMKRINDRYGERIDAEGGDS